MSSVSSAVQRWIDNAESGITKRKPGYVLKSSTELKALGELEQAEKVLRRAFEAKEFFDNIDAPSQGKILTNLCSLLKDKNPDEVLRIAEAMPVKDPGVLLLEATALGRLDRHAEAIALLEKDIKADSDHPKYDLAYKLAGLYMQLGESRKRWTSSRRS